MSYNKGPANLRVLCFSKYATDYQYNIFRDNQRVRNACVEIDNCIYMYMYNAYLGCISDAYLEIAQTFGYYCGLLRNDFTHILHGYLKVCDKYASTNGTNMGDMFKWNTRSKDYW